MRRDKTINISMKIQQLVLFILASIMLVACKTQKVAVDQPTQATAQQWEPTTNALLWKIVKKGHKPSYVYGTIHLIDRKDYFLPTGTEAALDATDQIYYEINMDDMTDMGALMGIINKAFMKDGMTLGDLLSKEEYQLVATHFEDLGLPMMFMDRIKPMFLSILAGDDVQPGSFDNGTMVSYEMELNELANARNMTKGGLETIDYQLEIFDKIPYQDQADMLLEAIQYADSSDTNPLDIYTEVYRAQNIKRMHDMTLEEESGMMKFADILLYDRNRNWIGKIDQLTTESPTFFAVGAGHLGGQQGVLALLKEAGFTVEPVK